MVEFVPAAQTKRCAQYQAVDKLNGRLRTFGRFVGDAYMRPVPFARSVALPGWLQRAAYMPPLRMTRKFGVAIRSRAGHAPPLPRNVFYSPSPLSVPALRFYQLYNSFARAGIFLQKLYGDCTRAWSQRHRNRATIKLFRPEQKVRNQNYET